MSFSFICSTSSQTPPSSTNIVSALAPTNLTNACSSSITVSGLAWNTNLALTTYANNTASTIDNSPFRLVTRLRTWISRSPLVDTSNACLCMWFGKLFIRLLSPGYVSNFAYVYDSISSFHSLIFTRTCKQFLLTHMITRQRISCLSRYQNT